DLAAGRREDAINRLDTLLKREPTNAPLLTLAGRTNLMSAKFAEAQDLLTRAIAADPNMLDAYSYLGETYLQQHRPADARREYERRAQRETRPVQALTMVGLIYQMENNT